MKKTSRAGVSDTRAGLQPAGLYSSAGLFKKGFQDFHPLDASPYLLFDASKSMVGTLENPTLDLDPSKQETLDIITATRSGTATYTDADGVIQQAASDTVRVDYTQGEELTPTKFQNIGYTDFSQDWTTQNTTISPNQAIAPDGTQTAIKLVQDNVTDQFYTRHLISGGDNTYTYSVYAKQADAGKHLYFELGNARASVNLNDGSIYYGPNTFSSGWSNPSVSVVALDDGWYRVAMTATASSSVSSFYAKNHVSVLSGGSGGIIDSGDGTSGIYLWGPQVEEGTTASDFVSNTTGSSKFIASATYGDRVPMILVEPSSENLVAYSEDFSNAHWLKTKYGTGVLPTVTSDVAISPDGTQNADKVIFDVGSGTSTGDSVVLEDYISVTQGETYTFSIYLKGEQGGEQVLVRHAGSAGYTTLTLTDEWVKYEVTETAIYNHAYAGLSIRQGLGGVIINPTATFYIWGAQFEQGSVATSYIPTSGSTVTRAADDLVISGSDFTDFYNQSEGTFYAESVLSGADNQSFIFEASNNTLSYRVLSYYNNNNLTAYVRAAGTNAFTFGNRPPAGQLSRASLSYKTDNVLACLDGGTVGQDLSVTIPTNLTQLQIGQHLEMQDTYSLNGHIKRLIYWPYHSDSL